MPPIFVVLILLVLALQRSRSHPENYLPLPGVRCDFEGECAWKWNESLPNGFRVVTGQEVNETLHRSPPGTFSGPLTDAKNSTQGHFLLLTLNPTLKKEVGMVTVWSPKFLQAWAQCQLQVTLHMANMGDSSLKSVVEADRSWVLREADGNNKSLWETYSFFIGKVSQEFNIVLEVMLGEQLPAHIAMDNINLVDCFPEITPVNACTTSQFRCSDNMCIEKNAVCDITQDCILGEDEAQDCDQVPPTAHCDFEDDWCGWHNIHNHTGTIKWTRFKGATPTRHTGPSFDHTFQNSTGIYVYVDMSIKTKLGEAAYLESEMFNPPPTVHSNISSQYYNSCQIRFHYHKYGPHSGSLGLFLVEQLAQEKRPVQLWWSFGDKGDKWLKHVQILPNVTHRYYFQFEARKGYAARGDVAIDDITLSPECFGIGIPKSELQGYTYGNYTPNDQTMLKEPHPDFANRTRYQLTSCGTTGRDGPNKDNCSNAYNSTSTKVLVLDISPLVGVQRWTVPEKGYYTIIAKGASGGLGSNSGSAAGRGAVTRAVLELFQGQHLYVLVGQQGMNACRKTAGNGHSLTHLSGLHESSSCQAVLRTPTRPTNPVREVHNLEILHGGGGGGGATYIFMLNKKREPVPVVIAAGGGGLGQSSTIDNARHHGHNAYTNLPAITGREFGEYPAGAGGGWTRNNATYREVTGAALLQGGRGGKACIQTRNGRGAVGGNGGFGGGGGGCSAGGGGGGFAGGSAKTDASSNGEGGYSYVAKFVLFSEVKEGMHDGHGVVHIIPAKDGGCKCDFQCVALDEFRHNVQCICPNNWLVGKDNTSCVLAYTADWSVTYIIALVIVAAILFAALGLLCFFLYNRYQRKKLTMLRRRMMTGPDLQLGQLRVASNSMMTEYNPNYEFGGGTYTIRDLKDIPRDDLRLVKALGQGAFGEVYQGFFRHRAGDAVEMPVAVKTLPELSTNQAETDFLMEALIMSKFKHPNIVHFIGVCFDKHPRFIVLELLAGGDLKTFLRESRPKPERPSPLTMKDLLNCAMDVAKGCKYMEENHFIHRDIAARNCLLTTKGPGRVVKIADFGMARDIYRADYYRKGGKAMLPIKWMPPEAFLDGIFTSKTDVWSFGVLLWEVMSLGYMPYTGCANREVMQLVTSGGRLEPPSNCPGPLYGIMTQCWHPSPEERPNFATILERIGYCLQDPDVMGAPLPVFYRPPSAERDATIMRPPAHENSCLQVQRAADYLVPVPGPAPDLPSSPSTSSVDKLLNNSDWESSFVIPESRSTQPLLEGESSSSSGSTGKPATVGSLVSLDKSSPNNNNNNNNNQRNGLKGSLSLDPAALVKQQPLPYVNVTPAHLSIQSEPEADHQGRPFTVQAAAAATRHLISDTEISC